MAGKVTGYSRLQVALHWSVVVLVAFQYFAHDAIEDAWRGLRTEQGETIALLAWLHVAAGTLILLLALARIYLRIRRGAPPPADEPRLLQIVAEGVHYAIYALLILLPLSGSLAWFFRIERAGAVHEWLQNALLAAIFLHVGGALFQHFVRRSGVMMRMLRPQKN